MAGSQWCMSDASWHAIVLQLIHPRNMFDTISGWLIFLGTANGTRCFASCSLGKCFTYEHITTAMIYRPLTSVVYQSLDTFGSIGLATVLQLISPERIEITMIVVAGHSPFILWIYRIVCKIPCFVKDVFLAK